jgi:hypothetical protein
VFLKVRDQVSHPHSTTDKITFLYILIFMFFDMRRQDRRFGLNNSKHSLNLIYSSFHNECHSYKCFNFRWQLLIMLSDLQRVFLFTLSLVRMDVVFMSAVWCLSYRHVYYFCLLLSNL